MEEITVKCKESVVESESPLVITEESPFKHKVHTEEGKEFEFLENGDELLKDDENLIEDDIVVALSEGKLKEES